MSYEVDYRPVGDESASGDAIAFRYGDLSSSRTQTVVVVDGGFQKSGEDLVRHIRDVYGTSHVDYVFSTHPDNDHVSGLRVILEELSVGTLLMHRPWEHAEQIKALRRAIGTRAPAAPTALERSLAAASDLEDLAGRKGVRIVEPFAGVATADGILRVLGPTETYYRELLLSFKEPVTGKSFIAAVRKFFKTIHETWNEDALLEPDPDCVTAENNSSVVLRVDFGERAFLFTGDAGVDAISRALDFAGMTGVDLRNLMHIQVPHHGSKRNVGPMLLNRLIGPIVREGETNGKVCSISVAAKGEPTHPSKRVTNALVRRGARTFKTQGTALYHHSSDLRVRENWSPATAIAFAATHDEEED